jgi:hypothetical protein
MIVRIFGKEEKRLVSNCMLQRGLIGTEKQRNWNYITIKRSMWNSLDVLPSLEQGSTNQRRSSKPECESGKLFSLTSAW